MMDKKYCRECKQYVQHYGLFDGKIKEVYCGHCKQGRCKRRLPYDAACPDFELGIPADKEMVSKEYLTKALLKRVLEMDLWADMKD